MNHRHRNVILLLGLLYSASLLSGCASQTKTEVYQEPKPAVRPPIGKLGNPPRGAAPSTEKGH